MATHATGASAGRARPGADGAPRGGRRLRGPRARRRARGVDRAPLRRGPGAHLRRRSTRRTREHLRAGRGRRQPDADPRPLPGVRSRTGCARRWTACGPYLESHDGDVELLGHRGRRRAAAAARLLRRLRGVERARSSWRSRQALDETAPDLLGLEVEGVAAAPADALAGRRHRTGWRSPAPTPLGRGHLAALGDGLLVANVAGTLLAYRDSCAGLRRAAARRRAARRDADLPGLQRGLRPAARRAQPERRRAPAPAGPAAARQRRRAGGRRVVSAGASPARRLGRRARPGRAAHQAARRRTRPGTASSARQGSPTTIATCCTSTSGGSSACARPAGRCARATPSSAPPACARCGSRTSSCPTTCGPSSGSRSAWPSRCAARRPAGSSRSTRARPGATECELELAAWDRLRALNPVLDRLEPDAEALVIDRLGDPHRYRDRADRPVLPARRPDQGELGGHLRRQRGEELGRHLLRRPADAGGGVMDETR